MSKNRSSWASRERWSEAEARAALQALASSTLGPQAFGRQHGFSGQRLRHWSARLGVGLPRRARTKLSAALVPVVVKRAETEAVPCINGAGGALAVRIGSAAVEVIEPERLDSAWLARFVRELGGVA